jgi:hypothetical protein
MTNEPTFKDEPNPELTEPHAVADTTEAAAQPAVPSESAPGDVDTLDALLAEYDAGVAKSEPEADAYASKAEDEQLLADLDRQRLLGQANDAFSENGRLKSELDQWRTDATALQQQHQQLLNQLHLAAEQNDFRSFAKGLQDKIGDGPPDFAERWLYAEAASNEVLRLAWDNRKVNPDEIKATMFRAQDALLRMQRDPRSDPNQIAEVTRLAQQCAIVLEGPRIMAEARARCVEAARKFQAIDQDVTGDVMAVVASLKGADAGRMGREPAPNFGGMSEAEFKRHTRDNYGF